MQRERGEEERKRWGEGERGREGEVERRGGGNSDRMGCRGRVREIFFLCFQ